MAGCRIPFRIKYSCYWHNCSSHGARGHMCWSIACLFGCSSSRSGIEEPILALKSPHTSVINYG